MFVPPSRQFHYTPVPFRHPQSPKQWTLRNHIRLKHHCESTLTVRLYSERPRSTQFTVQEPYPNPLWPPNVQSIIIIKQSVLRQVNNLFPKQALNLMRYSASSFTIQYLLVSLRSTSSCLRLLPRILVPSAFP